jgi:glycosyltransferase involved in cell wall biosynthesis
MIVRTILDGNHILVDENIIHSGEIRPVNHGKNGNSMTQKRKILIVCKNIPYPVYTGGDIRIFNLIKRISYVHEVSLICMSDIKLVRNAEKLRPFCKNIYIVPIVTDRKKIQKITLFFRPKEWPRLWQRCHMLLRGAPYGNIVFYHPVFRDKLREILTKERYDLVQFEFIVTGQYLPFVSDLLKDSKTIMVQHGMIAEELNRMADYADRISKIWYRIQAFLSMRYERKLLKTFDHIIAMSEVDRQKLVNYGLHIERITIIRSGVDVEEFRVNEIPQSDHHIVALGTLRYLPNREGLIWFLDNVFPLIKEKVRECNVIVVGAKDEGMIERYKDRSVIFRGIVDELETEIGKGMVFISPIRIGTGTRLKIVTAMAFGMPVVSTAVALEGIEAGEQEGVIVADNEEDFGKAVVELLSNRERRYQLGERARMFVEREYSWEIISADLCSLYDKLLRQSNRGEFLTRWNRGK